MTKTCDRAEVIESVCRLAGAQVGVDRATVSLDTRFEADLGFDSLDRVDFLMAIEDEFDVDIEDEAGAQVATVGNVVGLLCAGGLGAAGKPESRVDSESGVI